MRLVLFNYTKGNITLILAKCNIYLFNFQTFVSFFFEIKRKTGKTGSFFSKICDKSSIMILFIGKMITFVVIILKITL
jgi:hypothetical protein